MNSDTAIFLAGVHKTFRSGLRRRRTRALRGLDLQVERGEIFGFLGPNGAGKTTTIKILVDLLRPDSGEVRILGRSSRDHRARQQLAYLPELPSFYDYLNPVELLNHLGRLAGLDRHTLKKRVPQLLERVGLDPAERRQLRKFSKGMLQRVGFAQAMLAEPEIYILDEPMGGLDPLGRRWAKELISELGKKGKTVFFSSHVLAEAEAVCSRVAFIHRGQRLAEGGLAELLQNDTDRWEILVQGSSVRNDTRVAAAGAAMNEAGEDTLLLVEGESELQQLLRCLLDGGHRVQAVNRQHRSLEDLFVGLMKQEARKPS